MNHPDVAKPSPQVEAPTARPARGEQERRPLTHFLEAYAFLGLMIAAAVFFAVWPQTSTAFTSSANIRTLVSSNAVVAIIALAALVPLVAYEFDLSIGGVAGLAAVFCAGMLASGMPIPLAIVLSIAIGAVIGTANALLITRVGVNAVITTLGMSIVIAGIVNEKTGGIAQSAQLPHSFTSFGSSDLFGIPKVAFVLLVIALGVYYVLQYTPFGRYLYAFGSNRDAAQLVGIRTKLVLASAFVVSASLSAMAGILQVARAGSADPKGGEPFTLPALAAAFLSAAAIRPGRYNVGGTLVAIFFLGVLNNGLNLAGSPEYVNNYVNGAALIIGVALTVKLGKRASA
ncbi:MAG: ABC transporter permease [Actinobacteria bacterium]|nr:ABC transporter permease [Actinomycetota bacterium]